MDIRRAIISVDAMSTHAGGVCVVQTMNMVTCKYYMVRHDFNRRDSFEFEYHNVKAGLETFSKDMIGADVTLLNDNTGVVAALKNDEIQFAREFAVKSLEILPNAKVVGTTKNLHGMADDLSRGKKDEFLIKLGALFPNVSSAVNVSDTAQLFLNREALKVKVIGRQPTKKQIVAPSQNKTRYVPNRVASRGMKRPAGVALNTPSLKQQKLGVISVSVTDVGTRIVNMNTQNNNMQQTQQNRSMNNKQPVKQKRANPKKKTANLKKQKPKKKRQVQKKKKQNVNVVGNSTIPPLMHFNWKPTQNHNVKGTINKKKGKLPSNRKSNPTPNKKKGNTNRQRIQHQYATRNSQYNADY